MSHAFPALPYAYDALEPWIDAQTMEIHYDRHHRTYFDKFVAAVQGKPEANEGLEQILAKISTLPAPVRNNGGGLWNHTFFWQCMGKGKGGKPDGALATAIQRDFEGFESFRARFTEAGVNRFGSGFAWLVVKDGKLHITSTPNQDNPLMDVADVKGRPILALDVWEHAYYLKYQNKRPAYIEAWWNTIDWSFVQDRFKEATK